MSFTRKEYKELGEMIARSKNDPSKRFFCDTATGLLEAVKISEFDQLLEEQLKDPEFKKEWDALQPEMEEARREIETQREKEN